MSKKGFSELLWKTNQLSVLIARSRRESSPCPPCMSPQMPHPPQLALVIMHLTHHLRQGSAAASVGSKQPAAAAKSRERVARLLPGLA